MSALNSEILDTFDYILKIEYFRRQRALLPIVAPLQIRNPQTDFYSVTARRYLVKTLGSSNNMVLN